ncbi:hypothetical protein JCM13591A_20730 [Microbacterium xylanilyticum]
MGTISEGSEHMTDQPSPTEPGTSNAPVNPYLRRNPYARPASDPAIAPSSAPAPAPAIEITGPAPAPAAQEPDLLERRAVARGAIDQDARSNRRSSIAFADVIIVGAGRGGVGKTTMSIALADRAAEAGLVTIVIDANRGQADVREYLRLPRTAPVPTAYDAYVTGDPDRAIMRPSDYATYRQQAGLEVPDFAVVLGPTAKQADERIVSASVYAKIIDHARSIADLVIIDASIMYAPQGDLWAHLHTPLLRQGGAWLLGLASDDRPALANLEERLSELRTLGVELSRSLLLATRYDGFTDEDAAYFMKKFGSLGSFIGHTASDPAFHDLMNWGRVQDAASSSAVASALNAILLRVTGRSDVFDPAPPQPKPGVFKRIGRQFTGAGR